MFSVLNPRARESLPLPQDLAIGRGGGSATLQTYSRLVNFPGKEINRTAGNQPRKKKMSGRWGCRPLVGMGVMEVQKSEVLAGRSGCREGFPSWPYAGRPTGPESSAILPASPASVDRPVVHFASVRRYRPKNSQCLRRELDAALRASGGAAPGFAARAVNALR